jgi:hypothetical protein
LEKFDSTKVDIEKLSEATQRSSHPLDFAQDNNYLQNEPATDLIQIIFQLVLLLGFSPYRPEIYQHKIHGKSIEDIDKLNLKGEEAKSTKLHLAIHNILHVSWLKRLESSVFSLLKSVKNYEARLEMFEKYLDNGEGYILSFKDIAIVEEEYGGDTEKAFTDYDDYAITENETEESLERKGVKRKKADKEIYNIDALCKDL